MARTATTAVEFLAEGTIACDVLTLSKGDVLTLELKADRTALDGYERALVDGLFFDGRTHTTTEAVQHYKDKGFSRRRSSRRA